MGTGELSANTGVEPHPTSNSTPTTLLAIVFTILFFSFQFAL